MFNDSSMAEIITMIFSACILFFMIIACGFLSAIYDIYNELQENCITVEGKVYCEK